MHALTHTFTCANLCKYSIHLVIDQECVTFEYFNVKFEVHRLRRSLYVYIYSMIRKDRHNGYVSLDSG